MKISDVKAVYPKYQHVGKSWRTHFWQIAVRVESDAGVVGWGYGGGGVGAVEGVNRHLRELLVGRRVNDVDDISEIWDDLYFACLPYGRGGLAVMGLSGVDLALWDMLGRAEGKRVCELLGGVRRERVRAYATGQDIAWYRDLGFTAHKSPQHRRDRAEEDRGRILAWAAEARRELGPEALLMVDAYMSWEADFAVEMAAQLASQRIYWFEDVLLPDDLEGLAALRPRIAPILLAGGEHDFTAHGFARLAGAQALDLWQPDVTWCGGLTAALRIAALAEKHGIPLVPHRGGEVWGLHLLAAGIGEDLAELVMGRRGDSRDQVWLGAPEPTDGYLCLPEEPGFGVRVNEELL